MPESFWTQLKFMLVNATSFPISGGRVPGDAKGTRQQAKIRSLKKQAKRRQKTELSKSN